jgi:hypothetical protein
MQKDETSLWQWDPIEVAKALRELAAQAQPKQQ